MKNYVFVIVLSILFLSCKENAQSKQKEDVATEVKVETPLIALDDFDKMAEKYVNKEVKVQGIVDHVCKHGGKKLLLVTNDGDVHVTSEERFDEALKGSEITLNGIVLEERIDEAYCLKMEEDNMKSHSEGKSNDEQFEAKKKMIEKYRNEMKANNSDHISMYSLAYISHKTIE